MINSVIDFVEKELFWLCAAHDFAHIKRVYRLSVEIHKMEWKWDLEIIWISAFLHEILDEKFFKDNILNQKTKLKNIVDSLDLTLLQKEKIMYIVSNIWYWKSLSWAKIDKSIEFQIVEDADRIESLWAIGIARTFAYWGRKGIPLFDPTIKPNLILTKDEYWSNKWTSVNHFYEKLLKLKDLMNTNSWKQIAEQRHKFMETFLEQFYFEWTWKVN